MIYERKGKFYIVEVDRNGTVSIDSAEDEDAPDAPTKKELEEFKKEYWGLVKKQAAEMAEADKQIQKMFNN